MRVRDLIIGSVQFLTVSDFRVGYSPARGHILLLYLLDLV